MMWQIRARERSSSEQVREGECRVGDFSGCPSSLQARMYKNHSSPISPIHLYSN